MKKNLILVMLLINIVAYAQRTSVETIYGYLNVFPEELGSFEGIPNSIIKRLNEQAIYGYNTWRVPNNEELALLKAKGFLNSDNTYMTIENPKGTVLLVTDKISVGNKVENNGYEYIDLGLSVKWASCNVGATTPDEFGKYYSWGEIDVKNEHNVKNSVTYGKTINDISSCPQYDAARAIWGGDWRMPTKEEFQELINKCIWIRISKDGKDGYEVRGKNGNSIFLPEAGYFVDKLISGSGAYWTSTPTPNSNAGAYYLFFDKEVYNIDVINRLGARCIRPVIE